MATENITIAGRGFNVPVPDRYTAGNTIELTAGEASSIAQTFCENVRNNMVGKIKKQVEGFDSVLDEALVASWQEKVNEYASTYAFGVRAAGGGRGPSVDPETREALNLIKPDIKKALEAKYGPKHGRTGKQITEAATVLLATPKGERYRRMAKQILRQKQDAATDLLEGLEVAA